MVLEDEKAAHETAKMVIYSEGKRNSNFKDKPRMLKTKPRNDWRLKTRSRIERRIMGMRLYPIKIFRYEMI